MRDTTFWVLVLAGLGLMAILFGVMSGHFVRDERTAPGTTRSTVEATSTTTAPTKEVETHVSTRPVTPAPALAEVTIAAKRGDCWVSARKTAADGDVLFEGLVTHGRTIHLSAPVVWLRLGAAANVDVLVNGQAQPVDPGTIELTVDRRGVSS